MSETNKCYIDVFGYFTYKDCEHATLPAVKYAKTF